MAGPESGLPVLRLMSAIGPRPRELTGAVDLVTHYGLQDLYDHFCRKTLPASIADSPYLQQVVGHTEIRKGKGVELGQLVGSSIEASNQPVTVQTLDLQLLQWAFTLRETGPIELPEVEKGEPTICGNVKEEKDKKHKKKHKKHKHRDKDNKDKDKDRGKGEDGEDRSKKHRKKKRKHEGGEEEGDGHKSRKKKQQGPR